MRIDDFLEMFNNGDLDVEKYFNDYDTWFNLLKRKGLMSDIDPRNSVDSDVWQNEYLIWLYENDRDKFYYWTEEFLNDIDVDLKTKKIYWVGDRQDLASLFCDNKRDYSRDTIEKILSDDGDWWESYWETTDDVYRDVIGELNKKNLERLKQVMIENLAGQKLSPETEEMKLLASEQGHDDYWEINSDNVTRIIDDEESMNSLLDDELRDLKSELYSVHSDAYNNAHQEDVYEEVWKELNDYFEGQGNWISKPHPFKKDTIVQKFKIPISDFEGIVTDYLYNNKGYGSQGNLEYHGSFLGILNQDRDCLSIRFPDYPSFSKVDKYINEFFSHYI